MFRILCASLFFAAISTLGANAMMSVSLPYLNFPDDRVSAPETTGGLNNTTVPVVTSE